MPTSDPYTRAEIVGALQDLAREGLGFWRGIDPDRFVARFGDAWSPAENVLHLIKSTGAVTNVMSLPGPALISKFGAPDRDSVTFAGLRQKYQARLEGGADAGRFAPEEQTPPADHASWQTQIIDEFRDSVDALAAVMGRWEESDLDTHQIPHPLLGNLTVREMLFFTLYHHSHHKQNVVRRLESPSQLSS